MKNVILYSCLLATLLFSSCTNNWSNVIPKSSFVASFPKANKDLTDILGNKLYIKRGKDTTRFDISDNGKQNLITDKNGDTIFCGTVSKFRGLYYVSQQLNDSSYLIYAVKVKGNYLYGLNAPWYEGILIDHSIERGEFKDIVKSISADKKIIRLHPDKKEMKKLYTMIMDSLPPDTILTVPEKIAKSAKIDTSAITQQIDPDDFEMFSKVYPNPATDELNIELQCKGGVKYMLSDITGKAISNGELNDAANKVNVSSLQNGIYILTLAKADGKGEESVKIIKK
jgi:hypothetical protein